ncbi:hypothetical protein [Nocardia alni]|uniref:hypothetical protein n=1 Tax=Nocardia alni TaxID=2815723 RepID=UPI001C22AB7A|nr:hypothetical protein [Nocardia alni]
MATTHAVSGARAKVVIADIDLDQGQQVAERSWWRHDAGRRTVGGIVPRRRSTRRG